MAGLSKDRAAASVVLPGVVLAFGVGLALHARHAGLHEAHALHPLIHWLRDSVLAAPLAIAALWAATPVSRRLCAWAGLDRDGVSAPAGLAWALCGATAYALVSVPANAVHGQLFAAQEEGLSFAFHAVRDGSVVLGAGLVCLLALTVIRGVPWLPRPRHEWTPELDRGAVRRAALAALAVAVVAPTGFVPLSPAAPAPAVAATQACSAANFNRTYDVAAINVHIPYNRWGVADPQGQVYVLQGDKSAMRNWDRPLGTTGDDRRLRPRPLVLRANAGDCVRVNFANELPNAPGAGLPSNPRASMSVRGVPFDVQVSAGSNVGFNDDTTVSNVPGQNRITYYWAAPAEGLYFFNDSAAPAGSEGDGGSLAHGLFGGFAVEPAGSTWRDPRSGKLLYSQTGAQSGELYIDAVIDPPTGRTFRESIQLAQDELPSGGGFGFNYGAEPQDLRVDALCPDCVGEETSLSSWAYGDPAMVKLASGRGPWEPDPDDPDGGEDCGLGRPGFDADSCWTSNVTHAYVGDPFKFRYGMAGVKETHVFHMHAHQWLAEENDTGAAGATPSRPGPGAMPESNTIDSQTFGPMEMFTADLLFGAGSKPGTVGDAIFHCHLYPHFAAGFWALFRTHDVLEDGTNTTPDGVRVPQLRPLNDMPAPPAPDFVVDGVGSDNPGYPRFVPGEFGWRAPQPPMGVTTGGANGPAARRMVAGRWLDETGAQTAAERAAMAALSGGRSTPGAPFTDPCPSGARQVTYNVSAIQVDIVYNERGDHDTQGRILVLDRDVDDILAGRKRPEPLFARVNAGDCVNWNLTNRLPNWFGNDAYLKLSQTNMFGQHIHLVKYDVLASDGASNGWNYQQAAFSGLQADFNDAVASGARPCTTAGCRLPLPATYDPTTTSAGIVPGQTIHERWYADYELRTAYTHDHHFAALDQNRGQFGALVVEPAGMDFRDQRTGAYRAPINDPAHGTPCGAACEGAASGAAMDVIGPGADDDFREFGLAFQDFVSLTRAGGNPRNPADVIEPPDAPETYPDDDPGTMGINYRNAPFDLRRTKNGSVVDPAYVFSSHVFGDPQTPLLQAYAGDDIRIRLIQGAQEEQHQFTMNGMRWREEPLDPGSPFVNAKPIGVSEAFNFEAPKLNCSNTSVPCRSDFLYSGTAIDDLYTGVWGILRVHGGRVPTLLPLPDNVPTTSGTLPSRSPTALASPPRGADPGTPCPTGAPVRRYSVVALQARITYNDAGDHDPYGLVYALAQDEAAIRGGANPEPLVLRANEGDCLEVTLTNKLTTAFQQHRGVVDGDAPVPTETAASRIPGLRVSMHPQLLRYDARFSDGATIGYNLDQTVAPTKSITYRWYADDVSPGELGALNVTDFGDVRGHRHHGLFAGIVIEPKNSRAFHPATGSSLAAGASADIRVPGTADFREHVVFFQDGLNLRDATGAVIDDPSDHPPTPEEPDGEPLDAEDGGEKAFSYRSEPFRNRLGYEPVAEDAPAGRDLADVYDSVVHGDPATPIFRAYGRDPLRVRVLQGSDKPRQHAFQLAGHSFPAQPGDPDTRILGTISGVAPGTHFNAHMGNAGGPTGAAGDYLYNCAVGFFHRSGGLWGLTRIYPAPPTATELQPTALGGVDDPRRGGHPLLPLELSHFRIDVFKDLDRDGVHDANEPAVPGATVQLRSGTKVLTSAVSGPDGYAYVGARAGTYTFKVLPPPGYTVFRNPPKKTIGGNNAVVALRAALK